ncbi:hypothetical protein AB0J80_31350 [Actinoplanes sp. NPDC049548]|uniref:hypothetical protein n=1 Tax=Actinoplanes sp. NPDC049548 TaxID=3155152 RepID=UPI003437DC56
MRRWRWALILAVAGLAGTIQACGGAESPEDPPVRLHATAEQWRNNEVKRELAIALHNDGPVPVWVSRVEPDLPAFEGEAGVDTNTLLPAGGLRVDIPVPFGTGGCRQDTAPSRVVVVAHPEGSARSQRITVALPYPNPLLAKLLAIDCATERVRQSVSLRFGPWGQLGRDGIHGSLVVDRTAAASGSIQVTELEGNVLYRFTMAKGVPLADVTVTPHAEVPFLADPQRCDAHAFADVKKPFEFPVRVALDGAEPLVTTVPVDDDDKVALESMLRRLCGTAPS